ncbi:hemerythrin domain-containing protein [Streptomyces sp. NPDC088097]|uniref:hemerythrin domain-containing protein n=1 Tax=Streptomyces sp. NPDC088097 TaxID=3365823 RepID=UPI00381387C3
MKTTRTTPRQPAPTTAPTPAPRPDTHEMVVIHRGLRREARLLVRMIAEVAPGDTARARVLADHFRIYRLGLHQHHTGEDAYLWPPLLARVDLKADVVLRMEAQHERVAATLVAVEAAVTAWEAGAGETERDTLTALLAEHRAVLVEHLDEEEKSLLPLAAEHLSVSEWKAMGEHLVATTPKPELLFLLGVALEEADAQERAAMLRGLPLPGRLIWHLVGRPAYARKVRSLRRGHR